MGEGSTWREEKDLVCHLFQACRRGGSFCNPGVLAALMEESAWPGGMATPGAGRMVLDRFCVRWL